MNCETQCPLSGACASAMQEAQSEAAVARPSEETQYALSSYDAMRRQGVRFIEAEISEIREADEYDADEKVEERKAEVQTINARIEGNKQRLKDLDRNRRIGKATSEIRDKENAERATCPGPKKKVSYSHMGRMVTYVCQSKPRSQRLKKVKV